MAALGAWEMLGPGEEIGHGPVVRLLCSDTRVLNTMMSTLQSNGTLRIIKNPNSVGGNVFGVLSKRFLIFSKHFCTLGIIKNPSSLGGNAFGVLSKSFLMLSKHFCTLLLIILCTLVGREMSRGSCQ